MFSKNPINNSIAKIALKIIPHQLKIEIGIGSIFLLALLLKSYRLPSGQIIVFSLGILAAIYGILSFKEYSDEYKWYNHFSTELIYKALSLLIVYILFTILHWPGADFFINVGIGSVIIGNIVKIYLEKKKDNTYQYVSPDLIRTIAIIFFCGLLKYWY